MTLSTNSKVFHEEDDEATRGRGKELRRDDLHSGEKVFVDEDGVGAPGESIQLLFGRENITLILFFFLEWKVLHSLLCPE